MSGLQQVWAAKDRREAELALSRIVAAASSPEQALQQPAAGVQAAGSPVPGQAAQASRMRRNSFGFAGVGRGSAAGDSGGSHAAARGQSTTHPQQVPAQGQPSGTRQYRSASLMLPPGSRQGTEGGVAAAAGSGGGAAAAGSSEQQERLVLSEACELLLLQRWCREVLLHEFLKTLHLVSSAAMFV
jgi:hypothetical protein